VGEHGRANVTGGLSGAWGALLSDPVHRHLNFMYGTWYADDPYAVWASPRTSDSPSACEYA
jgi:hypothetical protein